MSKFKKFVTSRAENIKKRVGEGVKRTIEERRRKNKIHKRQERIKERIYKIAYSKAEKKAIKAKAKRDARTRYAPKSRSISKTTGPMVGFGSYGIGLKSPSYGLGFDSPSVQQGTTRRKQKKRKTQPKRYDFFGGY